MTKLVLCFIHIPKTAGTAIRDTLLSALPGRVFWHGMWGQDFQRLTCDEIQRHDVIAGHYSRIAFDVMVRHRPKVYMTLFREPISRAVSLYEYIVNGIDATHPDRPALRELGLKRSLLEHESFRSQVNNRQCCFISETPSADDAVASLNEGRWHYGLHSHAAKLLSKVGAEFGWRLPPLQRSNISAPGYFDALATPEIVEIIRDMNREDAKLVDYVARAYPQQEKPR